MQTSCTLAKIWPLHLVSTIDYFLVQSYHDGGRMLAFAGTHSTPNWLTFCFLSWSKKLKFPSLFSPPHKSSSLWSSSVSDLTRYPSSSPRHPAQLWNQPYIWRPPIPRCWAHLWHLKCVYSWSSTQYTGPEMSILMFFSLLWLIPVTKTCKVLHPCVPSVVPVGRF